jgi:hypothetical protein
MFTTLYVEKPLNILEISSDLFRIWNDQVEICWGGVDGAAASTSAASTQWWSWPAQLRTVKDFDAAALAVRMRQRRRRQSNVGTGALLLQRWRSGGCGGVDGAAASTSAASTRWSSWPARLRTVEDFDAAALAARMGQRWR